MKLSVKWKYQASYVNLPWCLLVPHKVCISYYFLISLNRRHIYISFNFDCLNQHKIPIWRTTNLFWVLKVLFLFFKSASFTFYKMYWIDWEWAIISKLFHGIRIFSSNINWDHDFPSNCLKFWTKSWSHIPQNIYIMDKF